MPMDKMELLKKLESMIAFQAICLKEGNWEDFDYAAEQVNRLEKQILAREV
jgi:hypothetical protein